MHTLLFALGVVGVGTLGLLRVFLVRHVNKRWGVTEQRKLEIGAHVIGMMMFVNPMQSALTLGQSTDRWFPCLDLSTPEYYVYEVVRMMPTNV